MLFSNFLEQVMNDVFDAINMHFVQGKEMCFKGREAIAKSGWLRGQF
jgi:hypothetical protein